MEQLSLGSPYLDGLSPADQERLALANEAGVLDYVGYWKLLAANGRNTEAIELAERFTTSPGSAMEVLRLAEIYFRLGLSDACRDVLKRFAPQYGHSPEVWASYASVLEDLKDWGEMRAVAQQIREQPNYRDTLGGYSDYLEGRAELGAGRTMAAKARS